MTQGRRKHAVFLGTVVLVGAVAVTAVVPAGGSANGVAGGAAATPHGGGQNFTVYPVNAPEDRKPGIDDASYKLWIGGDGSLEKNIQYVNYTVLAWEEGIVGNCGPNDQKAAGYDRGNDQQGMGNDDSVIDYIENIYSQPHRQTVDFGDPGDFGEKTLNVNRTDEFVGWVVDCYGNPDEPGWYRLTTSINGTAYDGTHVEYETTSHYFWVCDCESEAEAREQLGPPPSEPGSSGGTTTPTATATPADDGRATPTATVSSASTATAAASGEAGEETATVTATAAAADEEGTTEPSTPGGSDGSAPGFGPLAALAALAVAVLARGPR